jgi:CRISPR-associated protein Cst2
VRYYWQITGHAEELNRTWDDAEGKNKWSDPDFSYTAAGGVLKLDDDVLGFMLAEAAREEAGETPQQPPPEARGRRGRPRGTIRQRRSRLELTRAISMTPFVGDLTFNAASRAATPAASRTGVDPVPYGVEVHATRYQYGFALTPDDLQRKERGLLVVDAICHLGEVAGNHARFLFDFSPAAVVFRWTHDPAPRFLYGFAWDGMSATVRCPGLLVALAAKDMDPRELVAGGAIHPEDIEKLKQYGALVFDGVKHAAEEVKRRLQRDLRLDDPAGGGQA